MAEPLSDDFINQLLTKDAEKKSRTKVDKTTDLPRTYESWYKKLQHRIGLECENVGDCLDPKRGELPQIVAKVGGKHICRHCFLA